MASSGVGEPVQYLYSPDLEAELYQQSLMLTHPTNILKLDDERGPTAPVSTATNTIKHDGDLEADGIDDEVEDDGVEVRNTCSYL